MAIVIDTSWAVANQGNNSTTGQTGFTTATAGAAIFVGVNSNLPVSSITGSNGDAFTLFSATADGSSEILTCGYCVSSAGGSTRMSAHFASSAVMCIGAISVKGLATVTPFDCSVNTQSNPSGGSIPSGNLATTRYANEVLISIACEGGASSFTFTKDAAFTLQSGMSFSPGTGTSRSMIMTYRIVSSTGVYSSTVTSTNSVSNANHLLAAFADTDVPTGAVDPGISTRKGGGYLSPLRGFGRMAREWTRNVPGGLLIPA